jgi:hypothetical protein
VPLNEDCSEVKCCQDKEDVYLKNVIPSRSNLKFQDCSTIKSKQLYEDFCEVPFGTLYTHGALLKRADPDRIAKPLSKRFAFPAYH